MLLYHNTQSLSSLILSLVVAFFSALGVGGLSSLGLLDRTEQAGTSMLQVKLFKAKIKGRHFMTSLQSAATNTENIVDRAGQATRNLARQGRHPDNMFTLQYYHIKIKKNFSSKLPGTGHRCSDSRSSVAGERKSCG